MVIILQYVVTKAKKRTEVFFSRYSVFSRIWVFHFEGGGKKKKKFPRKSGFSEIFGCIPSFLDEASVSSEYHGVCVCSVLYQDIGGGSLLGSLLRSLLSCGRR